MRRLRTDGRWQARAVFTVLGGLFVAITVSLLVWLAVDQRVVVDGASRLYTETVPWTLERQRLARNLEELRLQGERVFSAPTPEARRQALFLVSILASHPGIGDDSRAAGVVADVQRFLNAAPARGPAAKPEWEKLSNRLRLVADDLSVEGGQRMSFELGRMAEAMRLARYKLLVNLVLAVGFLASFLIVARRYLIRPLQRIDKVLSSLDARDTVPEFPQASMAEIHAVEGAIVRLHATLHENERVRRELERLATTDGLTGLSNRRHFMALAGAEMARAQRYGRPITVGIADLDHFKRVNDQFGHGAGDQVLQAFAGLLTDTLRQSDHVCRYGGEEFAFVFPETSPDEALQLAERLRARLAGSPLVLTGGHSIRISLSLGLADALAYSLEEALDAADKALYLAKQQGRDRVVGSTRSAAAAPQP